MMIQISIKRVSFATCLGFTMLLCIAAVSTGCVGAPDEVVCDDPPVDPIDPVDPPQPYGCTVGEVEDWGEGMTPSIAGSDEGFAVVYAEWFDQAGMVRMLAPDGAPTSPVQNLPISSYDTFAQVTHGRNGYLVQGADAGTYGGEDYRTIYMMDQSGTVTRTYGPLSGLWNWGVSGGETLDWMVSTATYGYAPSCPSGRYAYAWALGPAGSIATSAPSTCLYEEGFTSTDLTLGFAARGNGFALGLHSLRQSDYNGVPTIDKHLLQVVVYDGEALRKVALGELNSQGNLTISRIVATDDGYAVRWTRHIWDVYSGSESEGYLTFLGPKGEFVRTVRLSRPIGDIAWNGLEIGEVSYKDIDQEMVLSRHGTDGILIEETTIAVTTQHYMSLPKIASAAGGFAIVWADNDYLVNDRPHLKFAPVVCE